MNHVEFGRLGENRAAQFLQAKNYRLLVRNYRFERAEIDIVASFGDEIIFIEVKTRRNKRFGEPEESVDEKKRKQLLKAAEAWLYQEEKEGSKVRFDVISVMNPYEEIEKIHHMEGVF